MLRAKLPGRLSVSGGLAISVACASIAWFELGGLAVAFAQSQRAGGPPNAPSNLAVAAVSSHRVVLTWDDNSLDEFEFRVERKDGAAGTFEEVSTLPANTTSHRDETVEQLTLYAYRIRACNGAGCSPPSNEVALTTPALDIFIGSPERNEPDVGLR